MKKHPKLLRQHDVVERTGLSKVGLYERVRKGLWPRAIKLVGQKVIAWPEAEVDALITASIAEKSEEETRALVKHLEEQRAS